MRLTKYKSIFVLFLSILSIPRLISFLTKSDYFNGDFAFYYFQTKDIVIDHKLPLLGHVVGEIGGFTQGALFSYLLIPMFIFFGGDPIGGKLFMLLISILVFLIGSTFFYRFFGKTETYLSAFLLGSSPYLIKWTNLAWPPYIIPLLAILYFSFLYLFLSKKRNKYLYTAFFSLSLFTHFEIASLGLIFPSILILVVFLYYKKQINIKIILRTSFIFLIPFIPHLVYDLTNNFYSIRGFIEILTNKSSEINPLILRIEDRLHLLKTDLSAVFTISDYKILLLIFGFILLGFYFYMKDEKNKRWNKIFISHLLLIIPTTFLGTILIPVERASFWWITYLSIAYIFISTIILGYLFRRNFFGQIFVIVVVGFSLLSFKNDLGELYVNYERNKLIINEVRIQTPIEYIYEDSKGAPFNIIFLTTGEKVIDYKYMFWFLKTDKFKKSQYPNNLNIDYTSGGGTPIFIKELNQFKNLKNGTYYIIISNKSLVSKYSNKVLDKNNFGNIISTKKVSSGLEGFTVQKRVLNN